MALLAVFVAAPPAAAEDAGDRCGACIARRLTRVVRARDSLTCAAASDASVIDRLRKKLRPCLRRRVCKAAGRGLVSRGEVREFLQRLHCGASPADGPSSVEPVFVEGPIGEAPPAVAPEAGATIGQVAAYCASIDPSAHPLPTTLPPLMALPDAGELPAWCDEEEAYLDLADHCGTPSVVVVKAGSTAAVPNGTPSAPFPSIGAALAACAGPCHVLVAPGTYVESLDVPSCSVIEGGIALAGGTVTPGAVRPRILGTLSLTDDVLLARLDVRGVDRALIIDGDVFVNDSVLRGGVEGGSTFRGTIGPKICRSHFAGNRYGTGLSWRSHRLWIAGSALSGCYEGIGMSWGSSGLEVLDSIVFGQQAISASWGSVGITALRNRLVGLERAVSLYLRPDYEQPMPASFDVTVRDNRIRGFYCGRPGWLQPCLPASDPALGIVVEDNVLE